MTRTPLLAVLVAACTSAPPPAQKAAVPLEPPRPAESLALPVTADVSVWFAAGRDDKDDSGSACRERVLVIHRDTSRIAVPLLYTGTVPTLINDSTIEAELWLHCKAMDRYRVNLTTGQPVRVAR